MSDLVGNPMFWILVLASLVCVLTLTFLCGKWVGEINGFIHSVTKRMKGILSSTKELRSDLQNLSKDTAETSELVVDVRSDATSLRAETKALSTELKQVRMDVNDVRVNFRVIRDTIANIRKDVNVLFTQGQRRMTSRRSPLKLTELGEEISQLLAADEWAKSAAPALVAKVSGMRPFEIQEFCSDFLRSNYSATSDQGLKIRACAYEYALTRNEVLNVLMVELRDELFRLLGDKHFDSKFDLTLAVT